MYLQFLECLVHLFGLVLPDFPEVQVTLEILVYPVVLVHLCYPWVQVHLVVLDYHLVLLVQVLLAVH